jgi:hypothetical protein
MTRTAMVLFLLFLSTLSFGDDGEYLAEASVENIDVKFLEVKRSGSKITFKTTFTAKNEDVTIGILGGESSLYDDLGNKYTYLNKSGTIGNETSKRAYAERQIIADIPTPVTFSFEKVSQTPSMLPKLSMQIYIKSSAQNGWKQYEVRNIPLSK